MMDIILTPRFQAEFWMKVKRVKEKGCWEWQGKLQNGYGATALKDGVYTAAHRVSYTLLTGEIPEGLQIDHLCRNPRCVNPSHLEAVTLAENVQRGYDARPAPTHCRNGHLLSGDNLYLYGGKRRCRTCRDAYLKQRHEAIKDGTHVAKRDRLDYQITSPSGEIYLVGNMTQFCRENGLVQAGLSSVLAGKQKNYKGWTIIRKS